MSVSNRLSTAYLCSNNPHPNHCNHPRKGVVKKMSRTKIAVGVLAATLALSSLAGVSSAQQYQEPPSPLVSVSGSFTVALKGKAKVKKRTFRIGTATCASGQCNVLSKSARVISRRKRKVNPASFNLNSLTGPRVVPITATISKGALKRLRAQPVKKQKGRRGKLKFSLSIQGTGGPIVSASGVIRLTTKTRKRRK